MFHISHFFSKRCLSDIVRGLQPCSQKKGKSSIESLVVTVSPVWHVYSLLIYFLRNVDFPEAINHLLSLSIVNLLVKVEDAETYICIAIIRWSRVRRIGWIISCVHPFTAGHYGSIAKPQRPGWSRGSLSELRTSLNWSFHFTFLRNPQRSATVDPFHTWKWMCVCVCKPQSNNSFAVSQ